VLRAKAAVASCRSAVEAAVKARAAAEKAQEFAELARAHAEGAARELLTAKKAEIQAAALLEVRHHLCSQQATPASNCRLANYIVIW